MLIEEPVRDSETIKQPAGADQQQSEGQPPEDSHRLRRAKTQQGIAALVACQRADGKSTRLLGLYCEC